ncbi:hypothetical protein DFH94DRAFT_727507 [Russula ochroleuca]|uniref:DUF6533 domain-containing protein n=1 Tax=Russula ochroleuca TaxID=152965 RepID=A0A9P5MZJ6_9AGAM|nr:hypothetical protein DFH94DRAFT_727507 [Russula ochroleuca]
MFIPPIIQALFRGFYLTSVARYLSVAGLAALLYDHALTIGDEIRLIWASPRSFLKWIFLINHYFSEVCLIVSANEMSGLNDLSYDDRRCRKLMITLAAYGTFSTFVANALGFSRVIVIWDKSPRVVLGLSIALTATFLVTVLCTIASIVILSPDILYNPFTQICFVSKSTPASIVLWAAPLAFEITVISFTTYSALSFPRDHRTPLGRILYRDGMMFFVVVALSRGLNIAFSVVTEPGLIFLSTYFSWATVTLSTHRFLIHILSFEKDTTYYNDLYEEDRSPSTIRTVAPCYGSPRSDFGIELHSY